MCSAIQSSINGLVINIQHYKYGLGNLNPDLYVGYEGSREPATKLASGRLPISDPLGCVPTPNPE